MDDKKTILAIDDNIQQLKEYKVFLVPKYDLRVVKSASDARNFMKSNKSDIILLDIEMPETSGFEFLDEIKKMESYANVPVIIASGNTGPEFMEKAEKSAADGVLIKPVMSDSLIKTIEKALDASQ